MGENIKRRTNVILCIISVFVLGILLFPVFWTFITSLKTEQEIFQDPPTFYPHVLNTKSYAAQIETCDFNMFRSFFNSLMISLGVLVIAVVLAVPASYAIARYRFRLSRASDMNGLATLCFSKGTPA